MSNKVLSMIEYVVYLVVATFFLLWVFFWVTGPGVWESMCY